MKYFCLLLVLFSNSLFASSNFSARVINNNLVIEISDDRFLPPFEAGELWTSIKGSDQHKWIREKEMNIVCDGYKGPMNDVIGSCTLTFPYAQFEKIDREMVFKATGDVAARLNRNFVDSAYVSMQRNQVYLSSYNTRRLFFFGISEDLIK